MTRNVEAQNNQVYDPTLSVGRRADAVWLSWFSASSLTRPKARCWQAHLLSGGSREDSSSPPLLAGTVPLHTFVGLEGSPRFSAGAHSQLLGSFQSQQWRSSPPASNLSLPLLLPPIGVYRTYLWNSFCT